MKIGIAQINTKIGDFANNAEKIKKACLQLKETGAAFAVLPELSLCGYSPKDWLKRPYYVQKCQEALAKLAREIALPALVGCPRAENGNVYNSAYFLRNGTPEKVADKILLCNYGAFDEPRIFASGERKPNIFEFMGKKFAVTICEDIWTADFLPGAKNYKKPFPIDFVADSDCVINISASLFSMQNAVLREKLLRETAKSTQKPLVFCNLVGGNDEAVLDGASCAYSAKGARICQLKSFEEDNAVVDIFGDLPETEFKAPDMGDLKNALVMAIRDFVKKSGFKKVLLGLSGGIDSAVVAALAVEALSKENVMGISLPSSISSGHSKSDAKSLAQNLGIEFHTVEIAKPVSAFSDALKDLFANLPPSVAEENLQARARGSILMAVSNKFGGMLLTTGNKSECAVGYCTLYGDMCGSFAPIADVYKTDVYRLAKEINKNGEIIPQNTIDKPPSAELRPNQKDSDSLPDYDTLDAILKLYIEGEKPVEYIAKTLDLSVDFVADIAKKVLRNEFKRRQGAIVAVVSEMPFGSGRRVPVVFEANL